MKLFVTGGAGFIGSHFIRHMIKRPDIETIINLDKLTYAGHLDNLRDISKDRRYRFIRGDIANTTLMERLMRGLDAVVNFAAETHVDRSIQDASPFLHSNVVGTYVLLESARRAQINRFVHISTDEVYGSIARGAARETTILNPSSPYSASKAAADHLVLSYHRTFRLPVMITRAGNNYGPYQYPEKFLPLFITHALESHPLPLYGKGENVREWLHVSDHCSGIEKVLRKGRAGEIYNIGTGRGVPNLDVAKRILKRLKRPASLIRYVPDRPGHDFRYAMSVSKMRKELGWQASISFDQGLNDLIEWYQEHESWWRPILHRSKAYRQFYARQYARKA
jgi:dTDP-glucose 4,6-dehydratase